MFTMVLWAMPGKLFSSGLNCDLRNTEEHRRHGFWKCGKNPTHCEGNRRLNGSAETCSLKETPIKSMFLVPKETSIDSSRCSRISLKNLFESEKRYIFEGNRVHYCSFYDSRQDKSNIKAHMDTDLQMIPKTSDAPATAKSTHTFLPFRCFCKVLTNTQVLYDTLVSCENKLCYFTAITAVYCPQDKP